MYTAACLAACIGLGLANLPSPADAHGDPLPERAVARLGTLRWRLGAEALLVAYLPDGKSVLTVNKDLTAQVWDPASGAARLRFDVSGGAGLTPLLVNSSFSPIALSADGKTLAVLAADGAVRLYDSATGKERGKLEVKSDRYSGYRLALSSDARWLALGSLGKPPVLWDVVGKKEVGPFAAEGPVLHTQALVFSADGKRLASGSMDTTALVWDLAPFRD